ncbi:MAG: DUF479 domain-containing protein [Saccharospirillaceae bacterium]|nr:ACP phosphodiesterase [Pseudomonadales bacterium]NRB79796.1 DUF479 domain-containing protein [Saccharospirillaceae bacterium]
MNWLAHLLLSKRDVEYQLGNFLADPLKGKLWEGASDSMGHGMKMHKAIDIFTDAHPIVSKSKSRLGEKGYLKGVIIDLLYDHFLALNWDTYAVESQSEFLQTFNVAALKVSDNYPSQTKLIINKLVGSGYLGKYIEFEGFVESLRRIDNRLSARIKAKDSALNYIVLVEREFSNLKADFDLFFPELIEFFKNHELGSVSDNYLVINGNSK